MDFLSQGLHLTFDLTITTDSEVLSFGGFNSWSPPYVMNGNVVWPWFGSGGSRVSFSDDDAEPFGVGPDESRFPPTTSCHIMHIISTICSFRRVISWIFSLMGEGPIVDISLARDLVMIGSRCDGNLDYFLWAIFSLYDLGKEKNGTGKKWGTFENLTMWKHKTNTKLV